MKHIDNAKIPLASKINDCVGDTDICKMWQDHYQRVKPVELMVLLQYILFMLMHVI